jgi:hypothetical protein
LITIQTEPESGSEATYQNAFSSDPTSLDETIARRFGRCGFHSTTSKKEIRIIYIMENNKYLFQAALPKMLWNRLGAKVDLYPLTQ